MMIKVTWCHQVGALLRDKENSQRQRSITVEPER